MIRAECPLRLVTLAAAIVGLSMMLPAARGADAAQAERLQKTGNCQNCDLRDAELPGLHAEFGDLRNSDLRGAMMYSANLRSADLTGALLATANLRRADLRGARGAVFNGAFTDEFTTCPSGAKGPCQ